MFKIRMGVPEMEALWKDLTNKADRDALHGADKVLFKKLVKTLGLLRSNPRHPSLCTHDIEPMSKRYGFKVWQSYLENRKPAAGRGPCPADAGRRLPGPKTDGSGHRPL